MSYLLQYARRPDLIAPRTSAARVDEYARLNQPGLYGDAFVRVFVEDTTVSRRRRNRERGSCCRSPTAPTRSTLSSRSRRNGCARTRSSRSTRYSARSTASVTVSPRKASLQSNESCAAGKSARGPERAGSRLSIEATGTRQHDRELYHTNTDEKEVRHVVSEASRHAPRAAVGAAPGPGAELGRRLRLGRGRVDAAAPLPGREARRQRPVPMRLGAALQELLPQRRPLSTALWAITTTGSASRSRLPP